MGQGLPGRGRSINADATQQCSHQARRCPPGLLHWPQQGRLVEGGAQGLVGCDTALAVALAGLQRRSRDPCRLRKCARAAPQPAPLVGQGRGVWANDMTQGSGNHRQAREGAAAGFERRNRCAVDICQGRQRDARQPSLTPQGHKLPGKFFQHFSSKLLRPQKPVSTKHSGDPECRITI